MRIQTLDGDFVKTGVALFTYTFVSFVLYGSSVGRDFARLLHALLCVVMEMARIDTNMTETRFVCDFVFAFALFVCASLRNATFRIASVRIASVRNASLQIEKPTLRQRSSKCRGRLVETHARMHHRFLAVRVLREVRSSCELPP